MLNRRGGPLLAAVLLIGVAAASRHAAFWKTLSPATESPPSGRLGAAPQSAEVSRTSAGERVPVSAPLNVRYPQAGGLERRVVQTGSIEALESADIHARVSGYLRAVYVNIGSRVEVGQLLAELDVPELAQEVKRNTALLERARGEAHQADARLTVAESQQQTAAAVVREAESKIQQHVAERKLRQQEVDRLRKLVRQGAIEGKILDERSCLLEMAQAAEGQARHALLVAQALWAEAGPRVELARAECVTAHALVPVAAAAVEYAQIMLQYTRITAPFAAVVTKRNADPGEFVRAATEGGARPLLRIVRTDQMKVVVAVPDRLAPFINPGDRAEVRIDALHGEVFQGQVARSASFQQRETRTMRVEIDLPNPHGRLMDGMYGAVTIIAPPPPDGLTVPITSLVSGTADGRGSLYVVRDGQLTKLPVWIGQNHGDRTEVLSGLAADDMVVSQATGPMRLGEGQFADVRLEPLANETLAGTTSSRIASPHGVVNKRP
jgi:RND family efflux transporter MFP subunit